MLNQCRKNKYFVDISIYEYLDKFLIKTMLPLKCLESLAK